MANRLWSSLSPYLQQHADNPVDWYPWGKEAFEAARRQQKPIFLSVGYAACHWCHVMEKESFRDPEIARLLNEHFIPVKVDREELPDVDQTYCEAVQALGGHVGWPLSVFLTPDLEPFFGGTYWPPRRQGGMPGFDEVLQAVIEAWENRRQEILGVARQVRAALERANTKPPVGSVPASSMLPHVVDLLRQEFDPHNGGFGRAPKFPRPLELRVLLRYWHRTGDDGARHMVEKTLAAMAAGGIHDQLGGGFHRYSVDAAWLIPHFEKMLYDNGMLALAYLEAWQAWGNPSFKATACRTLDYLLADMRLPGGAFATSEDADSEGEEGKFYLWSATELAEQLGPQQAALVLLAWTSPAAQVDGKYVLHQARSVDELAAATGVSPQEMAELFGQIKAQLLSLRNKRCRPLRDDKVLVSWNALAAEAFALAGAAFGQQAYLQAARDCLSFIHNHLWDDSRLYRVWRDGRRGGQGYLEDYAALIWALVQMYQVTGTVAYLSWASELAQGMIADFADPVGGGFFATPADANPPLFRRKDVLDSPTPSGNALAALGLYYLGLLLERDDFVDWAERALRVCLAYVSAAPVACTQAILAHEAMTCGVTEMVVVGRPEDPGTQRALQEVHGRFLPARLVVFLPVDETGKVPPTHLVASWLSPIAEEAQRLAAGQQPVLFLCRNRTCQRPAVGLGQIGKLLSEQSSPAR
ncbi:MAG: thioredoxin domain-containing protein [Thermoguttaceae bacterium]|nr:thioredoxin domain-containing protein [Thermoguttaceae bacterium]MDW8079938.1 thioredoxin domain-containing protein [Thermoguttaceae bacterium]